MHSKKTSDTILHKNETISNRNKETKTRRNTKKAETNKNNNANKKDGSNRNKETKAEKRTEETETWNTNNNAKNSDGRVRKSTQNTSINYMKVMYSNVDSLTNKKSELQDRIHSYKPHIIALTEVNPKNHRFAVTKNEMDIPGYVLFTNADQPGTRGTAVYIINHLNPIESNCIEKSNLQEIITAEIKLRGNDRQLVMCAYRSPNTSSPENETRMNNLVKSTRDMGYSHILLLGDFNHPDIIWDNGGTMNKTNKTANDFLDLSMMHTCTNMSSSPQDTVKMKQATHWTWC